jgi:hypothetical protein
MMHTHNQSSKTQRNQSDQQRIGSILVLAAVFMVVVLGFAAFTIDVGYIALAKTQLHNAADAATLGAGIELPVGLGIDATASNSAVEAIANEAAAAVAALQRAGDVDSVLVVPTRDVRYGQRDWDPGNNTWVESWGAGPYNMIEVTARRDQQYFQYCDFWFSYDHTEEGWHYEGYGDDAVENTNDAVLPLFFGPVLGHKTAALRVSSVAALLPGSGFRVSPGSSQRAPILPITLDEPSWVELMSGVGADNFAYNPDTGQVSSGSDGILEINIYPTAAPSNNNNSNASNQWTPGNRGTVDLGNPNNATPDLKRQILEGLNDDDLAYFDGEIRFDEGPIDVNGDPGISAAIKTQLTAIIGEPRAMPLFTQVVGQGNNTWYTLVRLVGIRIVDVKLTGGNKYVIVQPATLIDPSVVPGGTTLAESSIFTPLKLIR